MARLQDISKEELRERISNPHTREIESRLWRLANFALRLSPNLMPHGADDLCDAFLNKLKELQETKL